MAIRLRPFGVRLDDQGRLVGERPATPAAEAEVGGQLTCAQCGAVLSYAPGTSELVCKYCGHANPITDRDVPIVENDLRAELERNREAAPVEETRTVKCRTCAAEFTFDPDRHAGACPFCGQSIVTDTGVNRHIKPGAILPFAIEEREARDRLGGWLKGRWFAPGKLKAYARKPGRLAGVYLPYWTFDSNATADYVGRRGTVYHERVQVRVMVNGRPTVQTQTVPKVRWRMVQGRVHRFFDDVLVLASRSLPDWITGRLEPWDLHDLRPYTPEYVTGFQAEAYQVPLEAGFDTAHERMTTMIARDVRMDIGGDVQEIRSLDVEHDGPRFKHVLLPVWLGAFRFGGKSYRICINGRTGDVQGEYPRSFWKIAGVALLFLIIGLLLAFALSGTVDLSGLAPVILLPGGRTF